MKEKDHKRKGHCGKVKKIHALTLQNDQTFWDSQKRKMINLCGTEGVLNQIQLHVDHNLTPGKFKSNHTLQSSKKSNMHFKQEMNKT